jgi:sulfur-carrier protein
MPQVVASPQLRRFFPKLPPEGLHLNAATVATAVQALNCLHPGIAAYVMDERGRLRRHVNIFVNECLVRDRENLGDALKPGDTIYILQALSGG